MSVSPHDINFVPSLITSFLSMITCVRFWSSLPVMLCLLLASSTHANETNRDAIDFSKRIQPILAKRCFACHGPDEAESGISFAEQEAAFAEADSGEYAIVPGDVESSTLIHRITTDDEFERMPPEGDPLSQSEIDLLSRWIKQGANWSKHWAFQEVRDITPPTASDDSWNSVPIDAFIYTSLSNVGLDPNPPASRRTLIRRAYYDLTGLPPSAQAVESFITDPDSDAYEKLVDELLESPHYGERWGRHWLDLIRFAETNSFERDNPKKNAWKFRDYVIRSFNEDKPYDQFVREQIAGDELDDVTIDSLTATGYYRLGIWDDEPADPLQARFDEMDDLITTTGQGFLGLTINCARCHDHKIDPIPQKDYYSLLAFFEDVTSYATRGNQDELNQIDVSSDELNARYYENDQTKKSIEAKMHEIEQEGIAKMSATDQRATEGHRRDRNRVLKEKLRKNLDEDRWQTYQALKVELARVVKEGNSLPPRNSILGLAYYVGKPKETFVLYRGNPNSPAEKVEPSFPDIFEFATDTIEAASQSARTDPRGNRSLGRRRKLADWIASDENRLTSRVIVNRIWQFHFGRGIVRSSNNFGQLGTPPTHPDLLDWLAKAFVENGWKLKALHRMIMLSKTYQMASDSNVQSLEIDPGNDLFWRFDPRRLSAEEVRDSMLAVSGALNRDTYGPSIYPTMSPEVLAGQSRPGSGWGKSNESEQNRRSVYIHVKRSLLSPLLTAFDFPDPDSTCEARFATLQPAQALSLLNSDFAHQQANRLAESIRAEDIDNESIVQETIMRVLARDATVDEIQDGVELIEKFEASEMIGRARAVQLYCLSVLNWNEFLFVD